MNEKVIKYYFDFLSPYSYLSWTWVRENYRQWISSGYSVEFLPVTLAPLITQFETKGPAEIAPKRNYLFKDCLRKAQKRGVSFNIPKLLPFNSLYCLRLALAVEKERQVELINLLFEATWVQSLDMEDEDVLLALLLENQFDGEALMDKVTDKGIRRELKTNVNEAKKSGAFGVPTFIVGDELFWGDDSKSDLELHLFNNDLYNKNQYQQFVTNYPFRGEKE